MHGGSSPQAKRTARQRLDALVEPAIEALRVALDSGDLQATLRAARLVFDRCGMEPVTPQGIEKMKVDLLREERDTCFVPSASPRLRAGNWLDRIIAALDGRPLPPKPRPKPPVTEDEPDEMVI